MTGNGGKVRGHLVDGWKMAMTGSGELGMWQRDSWIGLD